MITTEAIQAELEGIGKFLLPIYNNVVPEKISAEQLHNLGHLRKFDKFNEKSPSYYYKYDYLTSLWVLQ